MAVPHFAAEYGESMAVHMAAEFTPDVATAVVEGDQLSRPLKQALVTQAVAASRDRDALLEQLATEADALDTARRHLTRVETRLARIPAAQLASAPFGNLIAFDEHLAAAIAQCERRLAERQHDIHAANRHVSRPEGPLLQEYLYQPLDVTFPVLAATLACLRECQTRRQAILRALTRRA